METIKTYFVVEEKEKTCFTCWCYIDTEQKLLIAIILDIVALVFDVV